MQSDGGQPGLGSALRPVAEREVFRDQDDAAGVESSRCRRRNFRHAPVGQSRGHVEVRFRGSGLDPTQPVVVRISGCVLAELGAEDAHTQGRTRRDGALHEFREGLQGQRGFDRVTARAEPAGGLKSGAVPGAVEVAIVAGGVVMHPAQRIDLQAKVAF